MNNKRLTISFAITVCNEANSLECLLQQLKPYLTDMDEIVVQADINNVSKEVKNVISKYNHIITTYSEHPLDFNFAQAKNHLNSLCKGEYIFQLDADELPQPWLLQHLRDIIAQHPWIELFKFPRNNIFKSDSGEILQEHDAWPDFQGRLYKNRPLRIRWERPLHEHIRGHWLYWHLPKQDNYAIQHVKIKQQDSDKWADWKKHYQK